MPPVRRSRRLSGRATRTVVEVVVERPAARPPARSTAEKLAAAAATARSWRARVTECADRAYSAVRGRIDWEAVAAELGLPLIGCLHMFDASLSAVAVRQLPGPADWSKDDVRAMAEFVADNLGTLAGDVWRLAGVYMNTSEADCLAAYRRLKYKITTGVYESIKKYREDAMSWRDIHKMFPAYKDAVALLNGFSHAKKHFPSAPGSRKALCKWTTAETERIKEIVKQHYMPAYLFPAVDAAVREFTNKPRVSVMSKVRNTAYRERMASAAADLIHGPATSARAEPTSGHLGGKMGQWTPGESTRLDALVSKYQDAPVDWAAVAAALDRAPSSCKGKHIANIRQKVVDPQQEHADAVNQEVQRQYESGIGVDWTKVSQVVGLSELECLELCRFSEGKARWTYDPDTFSRGTTDRMEAFIAEHYPPPTAPNLNAVSNHVWVDVKDCIRMAQLLRGEFEWTDEARARAISMREQGMLFKEIARQLSPNLTEANVAGRVRNMRDPQQRASLTAEEKQHVRGIVDKSSGKMSFCEVVGLVKQAFVCTKRRSIACTYATLYSATLPLYKARAEAADKDQIARDILSGTTTTTEVARRLDVPITLMTAMVKKFQTGMCSSAWTNRETEQLLEYIFTHAPPYNWRVFSALLGTKSQAQCREKYTRMKCSGAIPNKSEN